MTTVKVSGSVRIQNYPRIALVLFGYMVGPLGLGALAAISLKKEKKSIYIVTIRVIII